MGSGGGWAAGVERDGSVGGEEDGVVGGIGLGGFGRRA